jgi:hypothetical protein
VYSLDVPSGRVVGEWTLGCSSLTSIGLYGNYYWVGCLNGTDVYAFPRDGSAPLYYPALGSAPTEPLLLEGTLYMTFKDTGTAALFDAATGTLLQSIRIGPFPSAPVAYQDRVWVYNSGDGTWQAIFCATCQTFP